MIKAAGIADEAIDEVDRILTRWQPYVGRLRADSSVHRVLDLLIEQPVLTPGYVQEHLDVTRATAGNALAELEQVGIVQKSGGRLRRQNLYQAGEVLALMDRCVPGPLRVRLATPRRAGPPLRWAAVQPATGPQGSALHLAARHTRVPPHRAL